MRISPVDGHDDRRRAEHIGRCLVRQRVVGIRRRIPNVVDKLGALLSKLIGAVGQDLSIRRQYRLNTDERPIEDVAPLSPYFVGKI